MVSGTLKLPMKETFSQGDLVEVVWAGSWVLATYVEERTPFEPGGPVSHVVRMRGERMDHCFSSRWIRLVNVRGLAANLLRTAERLLVEEGNPMPLLAAARRLGVDLRGEAWSLAVRAKAAAGGARDETQLRRAVALTQLQRAVALVESGQPGVSPEAQGDGLVTGGDD